ncbi:3-hydroxypropanoate dehydrogenase [Isoptericola jiangsuensis]|uniref:3-hydroxypropanoate dehydrogenase n=1 Tax=Isoptericola jiangsuensis TaxID=548579 RepID=A0A2A9EUK1_9MICO|nr:malonic semialdehyde reductase [Isoptericola jiangsuensis]PFG42246.1 3-hydroxypropanoate dehydrogenase [Isoptericola jiangsuensis]
MEVVARGMTETLTTTPLAIADEVADHLFRTARTAQQFTDEPVTDAQLEAAWDLAKYGPTAMNSLPLRVLVVRSDDAKERLARHMADGNADRVRQAPVSLVLAADPAFHQHLDTLFPAVPGVKDNLDGAAEVREGMARKSALIQAGYLVVGLRAAGLAAGPMDGMDFDATDAEFFAESGWKSLLVVRVGHVEGEGTAYPRFPRLGYDQVTATV